MGNKTPAHVAIIPDGNRRWAKEKGGEGIKGHEKAVETDRVIGLLGGAMKLEIKYFSLWAFSTENWKRNELEKKFLFQLLIKVIGNIKDYLIKNKIKFRHIGRKDRLPIDVIKVIADLEAKTKENQEFNFSLFLDYGGRDEIVRAVNKILKEGKKGVNEGEFERYLDTKDIPDPDLIIRTGGEQRLSGLMNYQNSYAELYFTDIYFPDFDAFELKKAVEWFSNIERRFGGD